VTGNIVRIPGLNAVPEFCDVIEAVQGVVQLAVAVEGKNAAKAISNAAIVCNFRMTYIPTYGSKLNIRQTRTTNATVASMSGDISAQ